MSAGTQCPFCGYANHKWHDCKAKERAGDTIDSLRAEVAALKAKLAETDELLKDTQSLCLKFKEGYEELEALRDRLVEWAHTMVTDDLGPQGTNMELLDTDTDRFEAIIATAEKLKE